MVNKNMEKSNIFKKNKKKFSIAKSIKRNKNGYLFILPAFILFAIFFIYPLVNLFYYSFTDWNGLVPQKNFIGFSNYINMVKDSVFWISMSHNIIWVIIGTAVPIFIGLILSVMIWQRKTKGRLFFRVVYFLPVVLAPVVVGIIWNWIYNPTFGAIDAVLDFIGLGNLSRGWLGSEFSLYAIIIAAMWAFLGFSVVVLLAGLQNIDMDLIEAARIDGANEVQQFFHIVIPQLSYNITMVTVYTLIGGFKVFDIVYIMTRGGPGNVSEVIATYTYKRAFEFHEIGYGSALSITILVFALVTSFIFLKIRERGEV